ncbi:MAG: exodeoxyribonuclease VII small subunit [Alphaproteobacteria bacterium]|nr:exodeoxyribonuclease VII small subunit [Alphaproteobacteria bacterium]
MGNAKAIETLTFEDALGELETIVRSLESGQAPLEESITAYERGIKLKNHCDKKLKEAQEKIEKITIDKDGKLSTQPLDGE